MNFTSTGVITAVAGACALSLAACDGIFGGIYDDPVADSPAVGQLVIDATSWTDWYYVDLPALKTMADEGDTAALFKAQTEFVAYPIPMNLTGEDDGRTGQYMYWFDVFGEGISKSEFTSFTPTDAQTAPEEWSFAVHRDNVRTNGGAVYETGCASFDELPESSSDFAGLDFTADEWTENKVWDSQEQMLMGYVPSQGIAINNILSSWLTLSIPPIPPSFTKNGHVFILRLADGTCAALQLEDYLSPSGTKCWLTINYKYPY